MLLENAWQLKDDWGKYAANPLMWIKPSNENPRPYERFTVNYEPFFFCWKPKLNSKLGNEINSPSNSTLSFNYKGAEKLHPAEKPEGIYEKLIEISSVPGSVILDPFLGSGVSLSVAKRMGRDIIGIEKLQKWYDIALHNINKTGESDDQTNS